MTKKAIEEAFAHLRPGAEMQLLEDAARSRSEADWLVGMNATRAASIRLRSAFDGAVSLGRVQTPTLAIVARREVEIRAFEPEPYWLVGRSSSQATRRSLVRAGATSAGSASRSTTQRRSCGTARGSPARSRSWRRRKSASAPQLLYDLTSLQRHANTLYGFSARRTLSAAQRLYEEHKAITYPRTSSRFLTGEMIGEIKPTADMSARARRTRVLPPTSRGWRIFRSAAS